MKLKDYENAETTNIDFKEKVELNKPKSWLKSVSAFANSTVVYFKAIICISRFC